MNIFVVCHWPFCACMVCCEFVKRQTNSYVDSANRIDAEVVKLYVTDFLKGHVPADILDVEERNQYLTSQFFITTGYP